MNSEKILGSLKVQIVRPRTIGFDFFNSNIAC